AKRSGDDKTSIMFITDDKPGALVAVLQAFEDAGVNLSHIDKRPSGRENWTYTFFIDALGHPEDDAMQRAVEQARRRCRELLVLGGYPRATRIL
ncbi:MAG: ACT domain-containing protein, partial [Planctomycetota bacterium]